MATGSGQTLNDRINAARYALAGQGLARCVCKATTEEVLGPKKKHLDYLIACTHEPNVSIPQLANLLIERTNHIYWVVVFKALVTVHHLMSYGNERFIQYLASSNYSFELSSFLDKTSARDFSMSTFIRRYSKYINEKALSYRLLAFDVCKVKRGNEGVLRIMPIDRLFKTLPVLQNQLDALLEFDCSGKDLNNGVINACFMLLFRDLIGLFASHNDGIINLLNKYFTFNNRKMCREALEFYKKYLVAMDKTSDFLRVAEEVGISKDDIPDLRRAPSTLIDALEQHLQSIESNKKILKQQSSTNNNNNNNSNSKTGEALFALGNLTPPSSRRPNSPGGSGSAGAGASSSQSGDDFSTLTSFKDEEVRKALEEEARVLSQYGTTETSQKSSKSTSNSSSKLDSSSPKFAVTTQTNAKIIDDIFGDPAPIPAPKQNPLGSLGSTLLDDPQPSDGFSQLGGSSNTFTPFTPSPFVMPPPPTNTNNTNATNGQSAALKPGNPFPDVDDAFGSSAAFPSIVPTKAPSHPAANNSVSKSGTSTANYTNLGGLEGFGDLLQPTGASHKTPAPTNSAFGSSKPPFSSGTGLSSTGLFKGDLDSTLANLAQNLTFDGISKNKK